MTAALVLIGIIALMEYPWEKGLKDGKQQVAGGAVPHPKRGKESQDAR